MEASILGRHPPASEDKLTGTRARALNRGLLSSGLRRPREERKETRSARTELAALDRSTQTPVLTILQKPIHHLSLHSRLRISTPQRLQQMLVFVHPIHGAYDQYRPGRVRLRLRLLLLHLLWLMVHRDIIVCERKGGHCAGGEEVNTV
jgi:hypothetical protein